jgi:hypothetical protein
MTKTVLVVIIIINTSPELVILVFPINPIIYRIRHISDIPRPILGMPLRPQQARCQLAQDLVVVGGFVDFASSGRRLAVRDQSPCCGEFLEALVLERSVIMVQNGKRERNTYTGALRLAADVGASDKMSFETLS